jgi:Spy/CpxP family protein refolding chaperone
MKAKLAVALAACLAAGLALADPHEGHHGGPDMDRMAILLDLNDTQKTQVKDILDQQHEAMRAKHDELHASGTRPSREEMQQQHQQWEQDTKAKLQTVLTPEQMKKFEALTDHHGPGEK